MSQADDIGEQIMDLVGTYKLKIAERDKRIAELEAALREISQVPASNSYGFDAQMIADKALDTEAKP
jgi:hypothetical protein